MQTKFIHKRPFEVSQEGEKWLIVCDIDEEFILSGEIETLAYFNCELLNMGYSMGYRAGDVDAKSAIRTALGLTQ